MLFDATAPPSASHPGLTGDPRVKPRDGRQCGAMVALLVVFAWGRRTWVFHQHCTALYCTARTALHCTVHCTALYTDRNLKTKISFRWDILGLHWSLYTADPSRRGSWRRRRRIYGRRAWQAPVSAYSQSRRTSLPPTPLCGNTNQKHTKKNTKMVQ